VRRCSMLRRTEQGVRWCADVWSATGTYRELVESRGRRLARRRGQRRRLKMADGQWRVLSCRS
jgi:hypothetical protein